MHGFQRAIAERWIAGVPGGAVEAYGFHYDALMLTYRGQVGRFAYHAVFSEQAAILTQQARAGHGGFFVGRGDDG